MNNNSSKNPKTDQKTDTPLASRPYSEEDHTTWAKLFERQKDIVAGATCRQFLPGLESLGLDPKRLPDVQKMSEHLRTLSGWSLSNAKDEYLAMNDWFPLLCRRSFPVTDYIRKPHEIEYTPLPDLFHEYFGHLAFFTDKEFAEMARQFGVACDGATDKQILEISRIWWYTIEFGFVKERGDAKLFGAGLLSSPGEGRYALSGNTPIAPFDLDEVIATPGSPHEFHKKYFIVKDIRESLEFLRAYAKREGLKVAA